MRIITQSQLRNLFLREFLGFEISTPPNSLPEKSLLIINFVASLKSRPNKNRDENFFEFYTYTILGN